MSLGPIDQRRIEALRANSLGLPYAAEMPELGRRWSVGPLRAQGVHQVTDVLTGSWRLGPVYVFSLVTLGADERIPAERQLVGHTVAIAALPCYLPSMTIARALSSLPSLVPRLLVESDDFNQAWVVRAEDQRRALEVVTPSFAECVMAVNPWHILIDDDALMLTVGGSTNSVAVYEDLYRQVVALADGLPDRLVGVTRVGSLEDQAKAAESVAERAMRNSHH